MAGINNTDVTIFMIFISIFCIVAVIATVAFPSRARAQLPVDSAPPISRQQRMLEASNAISVMLFSNNFEMAELGEKALEIMGTALEADFIELWKNQYHPQHHTPDHFQGQPQGQPQNQSQDPPQNQSQNQFQSQFQAQTSGQLQTQRQNQFQAQAQHQPTNITCNQVCWWEKGGLGTHPQKARTISYDGLFQGWLEEFNKDHVVCVNKSNANEALRAEMRAHKANALVAIPVFFANKLWGFLRLGVNAGFPPLTEYEQNILRSTGLFLVASNHRHQTQVALKNSEDRFRDVTLATGGIVWELDPNGFFSYISPRIEEVSGYTAKELLGKRWEDISTNDYKESITSQLFQAGITEGLFDDFEHAIVSSSGATVWLRSAAKLLADGFGIAGLRGTSFNYTKTRETDLKLENTLQALQDSNYELEQAVQHAYTLADKANSANSAKQNFLNNISHEIRTPLNSISGTLYLLENTLLTPEQKHYLTRIKDASNSLMVVVDSMLHFSNLQSGKVESVISEVRLTTLFEEIAELFSTKLIHKNLYGIFAIASDVPINLLGDATSLRQIITNLLDNAIKFTDRGAVSLNCVLAEQKSSNAIALEFTISDTGIGIPGDLQQTMLEAFTQKDASSTRRFGGTGLGLTIAHQLININGGDLTLDSEPGKGTAITFTFRMLPPAKPKLEYTPKSFFQRVGFIVDDAPEEKFFINALQNMGYTVWAIHLDDVARFNSRKASPFLDIDIIYGSLSILQASAGQLDHFFNTFFEAPPAVVALTPQISALPHLPDFVTHTIAGPALTFLTPKAVKPADKDKAITFFHRDRLTQKQRANMQNQLTTIINLLKDSDTEGQARFNEIRQGLAEIDEKTTGEVINLLNIFQFSEAIPLLTSLKDKLEGYEQ